VWNIAIHGVFHPVVESLEALPEHSALSDLTSRTVIQTILQMRDDAKLPGLPIAVIADRLGFVEATNFVKFFGSSVKSMGEFWLRKFAKYMI
jgi:hypothetical protein